MLSELGDQVFACGYVQPIQSTVNLSLSAALLIELFAEGTEQASTLACIVTGSLPYTDEKRVG